MLVYRRVKYLETSHSTSAQCSWGYRCSGRRSAGACVMVCRIMEESRGWLWRHAKQASCRERPRDILGRRNVAMATLDFYIPRLRLLNWENTIKKYQIMTNNKGIPPNFHKPWFINPGLTLRYLYHSLPILSYPNYRSYHHPRAKLIILCCQTIPSVINNYI